MILIISSSVFDVLAVTFFSKDQTYSTKIQSDLEIESDKFVPKNMHTRYVKRNSRKSTASTFLTPKNKLFSNVAIFDFETICVPTDESKAAKTTFSIGKHPTFPFQYLDGCKMNQYSCVKKIQNSYLLFLFPT